MKSKVLFLTAPNTAIFKKKPYADISMGSSYVAGGLENQGFDVHFYDLNMMLGRLRGHEPLSLNEISILQDPSRLNEYLLGSIKAPKIGLWLSFILNNLKVEQYKYIAFSLERSGYATYLSEASLHFAILLASKLKKNIYKNVPFFLGGRNAIKQTGMNYIDNLKRILSERNPIDLYFYKDGHTIFPELLKKLDNGADLKSDEIRSYSHKQSFFSKMKDILPKYDLKNIQDQYVPMDKIFTPKILKKYPEILDSNPIFIAPYKFSLGCPFKCAFCTDGLEDFFSSFEEQKVVDNLYKLKEKGIENFRFFNNNINMNFKFIDDFHLAMKEADLNILFSDSANFRVVNKSVFSKLADIGCIKLWYGAETVSERVQGFINKKISLEKIMRYLNYANNNEIWNSLNIIYNFPHERDEDFQELLNFVQRTDLVDSYSANEFLLLNKTFYFEDPETHGIEISEMSKNKLLGSYNEINGLRWEEKRQLGQKKRTRLDTSYNLSRRFIFSNDQMYFSLRKIFSEKKQIRTILEDVVKEFENDTEELLKYAYSHYWDLSTSNDYSIPGVQYIDGNKV